MTNSVSAAAQQGQEAIHRNQSQPEASNTAPVPPLTAASDNTDTAMPDVKQEQQPSSSAIPPSAPHLHQQAPQLSQPRTPTPVRTTKDASVPAADVTSTAPLQAVAHGAPFRRYLNGKVTPSLLAGMKQLALEQ
ncbi:MAG: hypothetical protein M1816_006144 [Peltula sp. TS41687]|nr:MAG: hypothetical protein M1816_006144 [Peltula sp. TS41687]